MGFALASQGIERVRQHLLPVTQVSNFVLRSEAREISWGGRASGVAKGVYYPIEYQHLLDRQQYSVLLGNGSFFQFFYCFNNQDQLHKAKLAYYPRPIPTGDGPQELLGAADQAFERLDEDLHDHLYSLSELLLDSRVHPVNTTHNPNRL